MKPCHVKLFAILGCALLSLPAAAQSRAEPAKAKAAAPAPKVLAAATPAKVSTPMAAVTISAAGSVILLSDGIVANASIAQIQPPAPGFVYER